MTQMRAVSLRGALRPAGMLLIPDYLAGRSIAALHFHADHLRDRP